MIVLVTGGRDYRDYDRVVKVLNRLQEVKKKKISILIHGGATGADSLAKQYARANGIQDAACEANWPYHGRSAGPIRNKAMLLLRPDYVVAFPGGSGTNDMIANANVAGVKVYVIKPR